MHDAQATSMKDICVAVTLALLCGCSDWSLNDALENVGLSTSCVTDVDCAGDERCEGGNCKTNSCVQGSLGCTCGVKLACPEGTGCIAGSCQVLISSMPGETGGPCDTTCGDPELFHCVRGLCEERDCASAQEGCACGPSGFCARSSVRAAYCASNGTCVAPSCLDNSCATERVILMVRHPDARSCTITLSTQNNTGFGQMVWGKTIRGRMNFLNAKTLGLSFARIDTVSPLNKVLTFFAKDMALDLRMPEALCFDATGDRIDEADVELVDI